MEKVHAEKPWVKSEESERKLIERAKAKLAEYKSAPGDSSSVELVRLCDNPCNGSLAQLIATQITDNRKKRGQRYKFVSLMLVIIIAGCCGFSGYTDIARFMMYNVVVLADLI